MVLHSTDPFSEALDFFYFFREKVFFSTLYSSLFMSLSVVSLNARALRDNVKRKGLFLYVKNS